MAAVAGAGAGAGGGDQMLRPRPRRQRGPLSDLTNLSAATSVVTRLLKPKRTSPDTSIGSSTVPRIPTPPPPPPPPATLSVPVAVAAAKGKNKATRGLQNSTTRVIQKISKHKEKTGGVLPGPSSPPIKNKRKGTRGKQSRAMDNFIEVQRAYFAEIDATELVEEFVSSSE